MYKIDLFREIFNSWKKDGPNYVVYSGVNCEYSKTIIGSLVKHGVINIDIHGSFSSLVRDILTLIEFTLDKDTKKAIYFKDIRDKKSGKKTTSKLGKMIRKIFPFLTQQEVDIVLDNFRNQFFVNTDGFTMLSSMDREDFKRVYTMPIHKCYNIEDDNFTSLSYSCMQKDFGWKYHPTEAFASGDFKIFWIEQDGLLHARCVVRIDGYALYGASVYAVNHPIGEKLIELIEEDCKKNKQVFEIDDIDDDSWIGATFLKIECNDKYDNTDYVVPYVDRGYDMMLIEEDDHFRITDEQSNDSQEDQNTCFTSDSGCFEGILIPDKKSPCNDCGKFYDSNSMQQNEFFMYVCPDCVSS